MSLWCYLVWVGDLVFVSLLFPQLNRLWPSSAVLGVQFWGYYVDAQMDRKKYFPLGWRLVQLLRLISHCFEQRVGWVVVR